MATLTVITPGLKNKARLVTNNSGAGGNLTMGLYVNNHTPVVTDTGSEYTECTLTGYAAVTLTGGNWSSPSFTTDHADTTYSPDQVFTFSAGGQTIYGVFLKDSGGTISMAALLDTAFTVPGGGGTITIQSLKITEKNG